MKIFGRMMMGGEIENRVRSEVPGSVRDRCAVEYVDRGIERVVGGRMADGPGTADAQYLASVPP